MAERLREIGFILGAGRAQDRSRIAPFLFVVFLDRVLARLRDRVGEAHRQTVGERSRPP
jgi:hypothetical protein